MKYISFLAFCLCIISYPLKAQKWVKKGESFQKELNKHYKNATTSPLPKEDIAGFAGHPFFPLDKKFIVKAKLERTPDAKPFQMPTSTERLPIYRQYAIATFKIDGKEYKLSIFQNVKRKTTLFLPFYDLTSGEMTYGGGRYLDFAFIPRGNKIKIDFNQAYHPYCAYSDGYSCPIPPIENRLDLEILAGVKLAEKYMH